MNHDVVKEVQIEKGIEELIWSAELLVVTLRTLKQSTNSDLVEELERVCDSLAVQVGEGIKEIDYSGFLRARPGRFARAVFELKGKK